MPFDYTIYQGAGKDKQRITVWSGAQLDESFRGPDVFRRAGRPNIPTVVPESEENIEQLCWGAETTSTLNRTGISLRTQSSSNRPNEDQQKITEKVFTEKSRQVSVIRVENPDDSFQYVDVERIERITFTGQDGIDYTFVLNHT